MEKINAWVDVAPDSDFSIYNIPFGIALVQGEKMAVSRIGDYLINLDALQEAGLFADLELPYGIFICDELNDIIGLGKAVTSAIRQQVIRYCSDRAVATHHHVEFHQVFLPVNQFKMAMPVRVGDYTDFYSSKEHATNVGIMFRGKENALMPNWLHLPVAYHGRASSIVISETPIKRPNGQLVNMDGQPYFGSSNALDIEVEMAFVVGRSTRLGEVVPVEKAEDFIFGMVLFNDWSARDIQRWEYVPLGPFLGKNFGSTISPWIVTMEALEIFRTNGPVPEVPQLDYLKTEGAKTFDINLEAILTTESGAQTSICRTNFKYLYWNPSQQLAHHTVNGCNLNIGDMMASGTISGPDKSSFGSLLELSWNKTQPITLTDGSERTYLMDGDNVTMKGYCEKDGVRVGFGEASGRIIP